MSPEIDFEVDSEWLRQERGKSGVSKTSLRVVAVGPSMTILDFVSEVYPTVQIDCGKLALNQIASAVRQLNKQYGRQVRIAELDEEMISSHVRWLKERGRAADTIHRRVVHFMTVWKVAFKKKLNRHKFYEASIPQIKRPKQRPVAWSTLDVQRMLQAASEVKDPLFGPKHWTALIQLLYFTGLRIGVALSLRRNDLRGHMLFVSHKVQKDKEDQDFRLSNDLVNLLISLPRTTPETRDFLIPYPYYKSNIQRMFARKILKPAGLPIDRKYKFHAIRKTVATVIAAKQGKETAMRILGHSSMSVTERYLADPATVDPSLASNFSPVDVMPLLRVS